MVIETAAKSILRKQKRIESWFVSRYGMNLYRGCTHNCVYCDGRAEQYRVPGEFGRDVTVKVNAIDLLRRELDPSRRRKPLKPGFLMLGGGVNDSFQPAEVKYGLGHRALELALEFGYPVHVLTKSDLVIQELDLLKRIDRRSRAIVSMSFSSVDDELSKIVEPGVPPPSKRLRTLASFKAAGIACGMYLMPVLPFITDTPQKIDQAFRAAAGHSLDFVCVAGLTLKEGRQKDHYYRYLQKYHPELVTQYDIIYQGDRWGSPRRDYIEYSNQVLQVVARHYGLPLRIPRRLYQQQVDLNDRVVVMLDHIDYLLRLKGATSTYGYAAHSVAQLEAPLDTMRDEIRDIKGVGPRIARVIREIIDSGTSGLYEGLMRFR